MSTPIFMLSNDDGVYAKGIQVLYEGISDICSPIIYAPLHEKSASSHSITVRSPLRIKTISPSVYAVDGSPADATMVGLYMLNKQGKSPDWVISGINRGSNLGSDTIYSGTVAAAVEASLYNFKSIAISLNGYTDPLYYETCVYVLKKIMTIFLQNPDRSQTIFSSLGDNGRFVININVPNIPISELKGIRIANIGLKRYLNAIRESKDPRGYPIIWIGSETHSYEDIQNADQFLVEQNYATISIIKPSFNDEKSNSKLESFLQDSDIL